MGRRPVSAGHHEIEVGRRGERHIYEEKAIVLGTPPVHEVGGPCDGHASQGMANWARHRDADHRRSCDPTRQEAKVGCTVSC